MLAQFGLSCLAPCLFFASSPGLSALPPAAIAVSLVGPAHAGSASASDDATRIAVEIGFDASSLAAGGFGPESVASLLGKLDAVPQSLADFDSAKSLVLQASAQVEQCRQAARDGNQAAAAELPSLESALEGAAAALGSLRTALRDVALQGESVSTVAALSNVDAARKRRVPVEFMVTARSKEAWDAIESAVRREARCLRTGESLDGEMASLLAAVRAEDAVTAASAGIATHRAAIESLLTGG